jgi:hypothetical protein
VAADAALERENLKPGDSAIEPREIGCDVLGPIRPYTVRLVDHPSRAPVYPKPGISCRKVLWAAVPDTGWAAAAA